MALFSVSQASLQKFLIYVQPKCSLFQFKIIVILPVPTGLKTSLSVLKSCYRVSSGPAFPLAKQLQLSQPFFTGEVTQPSDHFCGPLWACFERFMTFLCQKITEVPAMLQVESQES